ncbi:MAG: tetratricopeptide repeat protein [Anaerolineae bacterium]|nr:tetratricopeptide repeat protein [Thermoflexales bacterium]
MVSAVQTNSIPAQAYAPASRLSVWCDRLIEAGWLAAVIVAPLFFNIYSSRVFEPDKLTTVRSIALAMCVFWLVKWIEERRNPARDTRVTWRSPLMLPTMILVVVYMISTALSVASRTSLLGSYQRLQGAYTTFSYVVIFFMIVQGMRTRAQLDRLITMTILNSLPIAIYGVIQRNQLDPLPWGGDVTDRVAGNMGNAIFIAAYLIMTFFLTVGRVVEAISNAQENDKASIADVLRSGAYIIIALVNAVVVLLLAGSRGPQLGFLFGMFFLVTLLLQLLRRRKLRLGLTVGWVGTGLAAILFLVLLNVKGFTPFDGLRTLPVFNRLSTVINVTDGTNLVRYLIWTGDVEMMQPHDPIQFPDGTNDAFNAIRPLIGYGPEAMYVAYNRFYPPGLANVEARNASPDRSHNETWDSFIITGFLGFLAYMLVFGSVFYFAFRWIGLVTSNRERNLFVILWVLGAAGGATFAITTDPPLLGVSIAAGVAIGLTIFLVISAIINARSENEGTAHTGLQRRDQILLIALISGIAAHFIEIHLGIAIASTRTHFWAFVGMLVVVGMGLLRDTNPAVAEPAVEVIKPVEPVAPASAGGSQRRQRAAQQAQATRTRATTQPRGGVSLPPWFAEIASNSLFLGFLLAVLAYCFTTNSSRLTSSLLVFGNSLTVVRDKTGYGVLGMFLLTLTLGVIIIVAEAQRNGRLSANTDRQTVTGAVALAVSIGLFTWVAFGTFLAGRLVELVLVTAGSVNDIIGIAERLGQFPAFLYLLIGVVMFVFAALVRKDTYAPPRLSGSVAGWTTLPILGLVTVLTMSTSNLQSISADIMYKQAQPYDGQAANILQQNTSVQGWDLAIEHYRKALQMAPNEDFYYLWLGRALLEKAKSMPTTQAAATKVWGDTVSFNDVIYDGNLWNKQRTPLPSAALSREDLLTAARAVLDEARRINPLNTDHSANMARMWRQSADITQDAALKRQRLENSSKEYAIATNLSPNNAQLWNEWGSLYLYSLGDSTQAFQKLNHSIEIDPKYDQTYLLLGDYGMQQANVFASNRDQINAKIKTISDTVQIAALQAEAQTQDDNYKAKLRETTIQFTKAISVNPTSTQAYNILTYIYQQVGDLPSAIATAENLLAVAPKDWNVYKNLMILYNQNQQYDKARETGAKAVELAPTEQKAALQSYIAAIPQK